jgi:hypothetical protein
MNLCVLAGRIINRPSLKGTDRKILRFSVETRDGHDDGDPVRAAEQLKQAGIRLDIIGIGGSPSQVNEHELKQMASFFEGQLRYWFIRDTATLVRKFEALALGKV